MITTTVNPHNNIGTWCYSTINLSEDKYPYRYAAFAAKVDERRNYRGVLIGEFKCVGMMDRAIKADKKKRACQTTN